MEEVWKPVVGYEGLYEVSNIGRVRSLGFPMRCHNMKFVRRGKILSLSLSEFGYLRAKLCKDGLQKKYMVHRLVSEAFIPNPNNYPFVNHKNEIRHDNRVENLEWCTRLYNMRFGNCINKIRETHINNKKLSKKCAKCDLDGTILEMYPSQAEAARKNKLCQGRISSCCMGKAKCKTHGGYKWIFI